MAITPVASSSNPTSTSCPHCGAAVHADQRYCLSCGQPCSPVRLAFLDVLRSEHGNGHAGAAALPGSTQLPAPGGPGLPVGPTAGGSVVYMRPPEQDGILGWLQRRAGALALASMLLLVGLIGLLVGHWITGTPKSGPQEVRVVYPNGVPLAQAGGGAGGSAATSTEHSQGQGRQRRIRSRTGSKGSQGKPRRRKEGQGAAGAHQAELSQAEAHRISDGQSACGSGRTAGKGKSGRPDRIRRLRCKTGTDRAATQPSR